MQMGLGYDMAYAAASIASAPVWGFKLLRTGKWRTDWPARFGRGEAIARRDSGPTILIYGVSVGEISATRTLVDRLEQLQPDANLIIASLTNTGMARAEAMYGDRVPTVRFPFDFSWMVHRFLDRIKPDAVALMELEVWPNFVHACVRRGIGVCVVNGRLSAHSFRGYKRIAPVIRPVFGRLAAAGVQSDEFAARFCELGAPEAHVHVMDTIKWDTADLTNDIAGADALARELGIDQARPVVVLGATGAREERPLVNALRATCSKQVQIVIVPRKPERFDAVAAQFPQVVRRSVTGTPRDNSNNFLLDTMGELRKAYALADVVIVGRSFNGWGASDPIEPIALGKPTIIGPDYQNFAHVVDALVQGDGIERAVDPADAARRADALLNDPVRAQQLASCGREVIRNRQGATDRYAKLILGLLPTTDRH